MATAYGNIRIVRRLLLAGSNRRVVNNEEKTALQIAADNEFKNIVKMLNDSYSLVDRIKICCNAKMEYRPKTRSILLPIGFLSIMALAVGLVFGLLEHELVATIVQAVYLTLVLLLYLSLIANPKRIPKGNY